MTPVAAVDDREIGGRGPITKALLDRFFEMTAGSFPNTAIGCTKSNKAPKRRHCCAAMLGGLFLQLPSEGRMSFCLIVEEA